MAKGDGGYDSLLSSDGLCVECNSYPTISTDSLIQFSSMV